MAESSHSILLAVIDLTPTRFLQRPLSAKGHSIQRTQQIYLASYDKEGLYFLLFPHMRAEDRRTYRRIVINPTSTAAVARTRRRVNRSPRNTAPRTAPKITEVSRSAATSATGACVIAHSAMP